MTEQAKALANKLVEKIRIEVFEECKLPTGDLWYWAPVFERLIDAEFAKVFKERDDLRVALRELVGLLKRVVELGFPIPVATVQKAIELRGEIATILPAAEKLLDPKMVEDTK